MLVGIGSRLELPYMRWAGMGRLIERPEAPPRLIRIDIDPAEMTRLEPHVALATDSAVGAAALAAAVLRIGRNRTGGRQRIAAAKATAARKVARIQPQLAYLEAIRRVLPRDGFFVEELCQAGFTSYFGFPVYEPRTCVSPGFQGTLGFGYPTALGVKAANPDRAVVSIAGDGGFMFGVQELATAVQERLAVIVVLFNNAGFGNVRRDQQQSYGGRLLGSELKNPDFVRLAESFGVDARRIAAPDELAPALERALSLDAPALIEVTLPPDGESSPWPFIMPPPR